MPSPQHVHEVLIRATSRQVWTALTDPDWTLQYHASTAVESSLEAGSGIRYVRPDGASAAEGTIEVIEPGRRLVMTWTSLRDAQTSVEPASRVEWSLEPANADGSVTRVRVQHYDLGMSPSTWLEAAGVWGVVVDGLKTLLETGSPLGPVDPAGDGEPTDPDPAKEVERRWHRGLAVAANNSTWELLDGRDLDDDAAFDLLGRAHAAAHHWRAHNGPDSINAARAAWLCSRAHAVLADGTAALRLAETCARITGSAGESAADFDRVYAVEAKARALACLGRTEEAGQLRAAAIEATAALADSEDRAIVEADLAAGPWFDLP